MRIVLIIMALFLTACVSRPVDPLDPQGKCGANGTVDMDPNPADPPPHCG